MVESTQRSDEISIGVRVKTASKKFGQVFVYKILSKSPMYHKSKQHRQYTLVLPVAPIVELETSKLELQQTIKDERKNRPPFKLPQ